MKSEVAKILFIIEGLQESEKDASEMVEKVLSAKLTFPSTVQVVFDYVVAFSMIEKQNFQAVVAPKFISHRFNTGCFCEMLDQLVEFHAELIIIEDFIILDIASAIERQVKPKVYATVSDTDESHDNESFVHAVATLPTAAVFVPQADVLPFTSTFTSTSTSTSTITSTSSKGTVRKTVRAPMRRKRLHQEVSKQEQDEKEQEVQHWKRNYELMELKCKELEAQRLMPTAQTHGPPVPTHYPPRPHSYLHTTSIPSVQSTHYHRNVHYNPHDNSSYPTLPVAYYNNNNPQYPHTSHSVPHYHHHNPHNPHHHTHHNEAPRFQHQQHQGTSTNTTAAASATTNNTSCISEDSSCLFGVVTRTDSEMSAEDMDALGALLTDDEPFVYA